jgi:hypothetical protein
MPLEPEDLVLPRTVALELVHGYHEPLELSSRQRTETRRFELTLYSQFRGDINDIVELFYAKLHAGGDFYDFPNGDLSSVAVDGKILWDNFHVRYKEEFEFKRRTIYVASIQFDAITTWGD